MSSSFNGLKCFQYRVGREMTVFVLLQVSRILENKRQEGSRRAKYSLEGEGTYKEIW
jgi:hypothetical protein